MSLSCDEILYGEKTEGILKLFLVCRIHSRDQRGAIMVTSSFRETVYAQTKARLQLRRARDKKHRNEPCLHLLKMWWHSSSFPVHAALHLQYLCEL